MLLWALLARAGPQRTGAQIKRGITKGGGGSSTGLPSLSSSPATAALPEFPHRTAFSNTAARNSSSTSSSTSTAANQNTPSYSYVIVGAGSAGCVLANRLSEDAHESVLLLEAGPKDMLLGSVRLSWKIHMPAALTYNLSDDKYNWYYHTLPQAHMDDRVMYWPRGRVWGGSSSLNAMVYIRGHAEDYNRWQTEGAQGWDYQHCLPYFRKAQCHELGEDRYCQ
ncbi:hypothetical protein CRUP_024960 [Coryphaenoides rupestris]|nr:hypothetical protein CRUP_024960 [Coryphaenoides rupestris]